MLRKVVPLFLVLALLLPVACSTTPASTADPIKLVPHEVNIMGYVDVGKGLTDEVLPRTYALLPRDPDDPQTLDAALDEIAVQVGLEVERFRECWFFGDASDMAKRGGYFGIIVKGDFTAIELLDPIGVAVGEHLKPISYGGHTIHTFGTEEWGISLLDNDTFVAGGMALVKDVISIEEGHKAGLSGKLLDEYSGLGNGLFRVASIVPEGLRGGVKEHLEKLVPLPLDVSAIADMETAGVILNLEAQSLTVDSKFCFTNDDSAEDAELLLKSVGAFVRLLELPTPVEELGKLLEGIQVSRSGPCVEATLQVPTSEIEKLLPK